MVGLDPALALVTAYLGVNGYFVLSEFEVHVREGPGYRSLTDLDLLAVRHPAPAGPPHYRGAAEGVAECLVVTGVDPALGVAEDRADVLIGEVKAGEAAHNAPLDTPGVLHAALRRVGDVFGAPLDEVVDGLRAHGMVQTPRAQVRLAAFGSHGSVPLGISLHHDHLAGFLRAHLHRFGDLHRATRFGDPVLGVLWLLERGEQ